MARLRNVSDSALHVPLLGREVAMDEVVDIPDDVFLDHVWPATQWSEVQVPRKRKGEE